MRIVMAGALIAGLIIAGSADAQQARPPIRVGPATTATPAPAPAPAPPIAPQPTYDRTARAIANLEALRQGRLFTSDLSPQDLQDVLDLDRLVRGGALADNRSFVQQCIDEEVRRNGGEPTRLAWEVIRLKCR
jgi:hypothetical protein